MLQFPIILPHLSQWVLPMVFSYCFATAPIVLISLLRVLYFAFVGGVACAATSVLSFSFHFFFIYLLSLKSFKWRVGGASSTVFNKEGEKNFQWLMRIIPYSYNKDLMVMGLSAYGDKEFKVHHYDSNVAYCCFFSFVKSH